MQIAYLQSQTNKDGSKPRNNSSIRSRKSDKSIERNAVPNISDPLRERIAKDASTVLNNALNKGSPITAYHDTKSIIDHLKSANFIAFANQVATDYDGDLRAFDQMQQATLLLHMLHSREERNIDDSVLNFIDESLDDESFKGLFSNRTVKKLLDIIVQHLAFAARRKKIKLKEAEQLLIFSVMNFECQDRGVETIIKQCLITQINQALSKEEGRKKWAQI